jgi:hypothetical protein
MPTTSRGAEGAAPNAGAQAIIATSRLEPAQSLRREDVVLDR